MLTTESTETRRNESLLFPGGSSGGAGEPKELALPSTAFSETLTDPLLYENDPEPRSKHFVSTRNPCKLCTPLGACLAFRGIEGCIPFLHGSQGCATYMRRYLISHFREPIDIASSNFHEESAIFGGKSNFTTGIRNVLCQYEPGLVGVATTCLAETIGEDMPRLLDAVRGGEVNPAEKPIVQVSTASYRGTHVDGFHQAVRALVEQLTTSRIFSHRLNLFPGMVSAEDLRWLKEVLFDFGISYALVPDYSETMDGATWSAYEKLPRGGTPLPSLRAAGGARLSIEFGQTLKTFRTAGQVMLEKCAVPRRLLGLPIGLRETDRFLAVLEKTSAHKIPEKYTKERGRLVDSYIDGHKYVFEKRALVYGEEDLVIGLASFLCEIGVVPALCCSGGKSGNFEKCLRASVPELPDTALVKEGFDFAEMAQLAPALQLDFLLGNSKGYAIARQLKVPLIRVGFPIHDRLGGHRILHLGYRGAQMLFDRLVNTLLEEKQKASSVGYSYL